MDDFDTRLLQQLSLSSKQPRPDDSDTTEAPHQPHPQPAPPRSGANTGPKGVINDYKQYQSELKAAESARQSAYAEKISAKTLKSGWYQRTMAAEKFQDKEEDDEEENIDELIRQLEDEDDDCAETGDKMSRLVALTRQSIASHSRSYGSPRLITTDAQYLSTLENPDPSLTTILHLVHPQSSSCKQVSMHFKHLAKIYPHTLFCEYDGHGAVDIPRELYPVILGYSGGICEVNLVGWSKDLSGGGSWIECDEVERLLERNGLLNEGDRVDLD